MADAQPKAQQRRGRLFDGQTARPHAVIVQRASDGLMLVRIDGEEMLAWHDLRRSKDGLSLTDPGRPDWRISLTEPLPADWQALVAQTGGISEDDRRRVGIAVVGVAVLGLGLWFGGNAVLNAAAHRLPRSVMVPIGIGIVQGLGRSCKTQAGTAAAQALMARLQGSAPAETVKLTIIDAPIVNAMALPGGQVVIFDKLIADAQSPDELAGVLAHELSHIKARDSERALVRQLGLSLLLQSLGGNIGAGADTLLLLSSSREAEAAADDGAIDLLKAAKVATAPTADFFDRQTSKATPGKAVTTAKPQGKQAEKQQDKQGDLDAAAERLARLADFAASHPDDGSRSRLFKTAALSSGVTPALDAGQWQALRAMCAASRPQSQPQSQPAKARASTAS